MNRKVLRSSLALTAIVALAAIIVTSGTGSLSTTRATQAAAPATPCQLGNGISHVVNIVFDNVHFSRDNPNVPSDLEQMPHLLDFLKPNGTVFSNSHTPLIAHTADDSLTMYTGLYGDRHGQPLSNSYKTFNPNGTTIRRRRSRTGPRRSSTPTRSPAAGHGDAAPSMVVLGHGSAPAARRTASRPRRGCRSRALAARSATFRRRIWCSRTRPSTSRRCLARLPPRRPDRRRTDSFKDPEVAEYVGEAIHCAQGACALRELRRGPSPTRCRPSRKAIRLPGALRRQRHRPSSARART